MFRLLRLFFWLAAFCAILYFAATVNLGDRTLLGHLHAIASTHEAKDLADGTRKEARRVKEKVQHDLQDDDTAKRTGNAVEQLDDRDRSALDKVVRERTAK